MSLTERLDELCAKGSLESYNLEPINEFDEVCDWRDEIDGFRHSERLTLCFSNGEKLNLSILCSGSSENTCFVLFA